MKKRIVPYLPHERISMRTAIWSCLLGVGLVAPLIIILASLQLPSTLDGDTAQQERYFDYVRYPGVLFLKAVVIYPLLEEIFFRGIVLQFLRRYTPILVSVFLSAAFFGITHLGYNVATALNAFLLGCFFAWIVVRSHSLYSSILCHSAFNFSWLFLIGPAFGLTERMLQPPTSHSQNPLEIFPVWWMLISIGLIVCGLIMLTKEFSRNEPNDSIKGN